MPWRRYRPTPIAFIGLAIASLGASRTTDLPKPTFDDDGNLNRPVRYREWVYIGTPLTPNSLNPPEAAFPEFHNVYIHPSDFEHWQRTGTFADGTVIIKELVLVGSEQAVSGNGFFMGDFVGLEATIKDADRFKDEPGHWAYFSFGHSYPLADSAAAFPTASCNSCHEASAADDFVFTQYYPVLRAAKGELEMSGKRMGPGAESFDAIDAAMAGALAGAMEPTAPLGSVQSVVPTGRRPFRVLVERVVPGLCRPGILESSVAWTPHQGRAAGPCLSGSVAPPSSSSSRLAESLSAPWRR